MFLKNQTVSNVSEAFAVLEQVISKVTADHRLRRCTVADVEATVKEPALIGSPVVRYTDDAIQGVTTAASSQSIIEGSFDFGNTHNGGKHLETAVLLKGGFPKNNEDDYFQALPDISFDIDAAKRSQWQLVDAQLMWNSGLFSSQWHADLRPRARAA